MGSDIGSSPLGARVRAVLERMDADVAATLADLGIPDYRPVFSAVVRAVAESGPMTIRDLAAALGITHSAASQRVTDMRKRGLVELEPGADARERLVHLTDPTLAIKPALDAEWEATERAFAALNSELTATLSQVVTEMNAALDRRSFRDRIADAAAALPDIAETHRAAITKGATS
jgi:DNA-binding MarR family transcriptional regulator